MYMIFLLCYKMWAIPTGASWLLKQKKKSPSSESRVPETGSDPPIGSDRGSGRDKSYRRGVLEPLRHSRG